MKLEGRVAVVTGAAGGIGAALARRLLEQGAKVVASDLDDQRLEHTVAELREVAPGRIVAALGDASRHADIARFVAEAEAAFGPVDVYVANAGVGDGSGLAATEGEWELALDVNLLGHVRAARLLVPSWLERGGGYFVSTASAAGLLTQIGSATYSASKHAAVGFAEWLAVTYGDRGIGVSCVCPMGVETDLLRSGMSSADDGGGLAVAAVTGAGEVLTPLAVADRVLTAVEEETFLVLPHPEVAELVRRRADDHDRWIHGMQRYASILQGQAGKERDL